MLAANPRTARGFSGDLILDEFAFHEDSAAIWEAAEPIISSNPDFLCRILSTGNGRRNMFYQLISEGRIKYRRIRRSDAWAAGELKIYSQVDGRELTSRRSPRAEQRQARLRSKLRVRLRGRKRAAPHRRTHQRGGTRGPRWRASTGRPGAPPRWPGWPRCAGWLEAGLDVGRSRDLSVLTVAGAPVGHRNAPPRSACWRWKTCACPSSKSNSTRCARCRILPGSRST